MTGLTEGAVIRTENDAVIEQTRLSTLPDEVEPGKIYVVSTPEGRDVIDLTGDDYRDTPRRKRGTVVVDDVDAFAIYYSKHADDASEVYADIDRATVTAVLDAHQGGAARWEEHWLQLKLQHTREWKTWAGNDRRYMSQTDFAEFLEDNLVDLAPEPVDAATMLEVATSFQAKTKVSFSSGTVLASGDLRLNYEEETAATAGAKGQISVPKLFAIGIAPYDDTAPYRVEARFRHRISKGSLQLCYVLDRPQDIVRDAVKTVVEKVEEACGITVMRGTPAR